MALTYNLILSNNYESLCDLYPTIKNKYDIMSLELGQLIVNEAIRDLRAQPAMSYVPEIILIGGDNEKIWETLTQPLIKYIRDQEIFIKVILDINNISFLISEDILNYLKLNSINISLFITPKSYDKNILKQILTVKPLTFIKFFIDEQNLSQVYDYYLELNNIKVKNLRFVFDYNNFFNFEESRRQLYLYSNKISQFILNNFTNNEVILIPEDVALTFLKVLIIDMKLLNKINTFDIYYSHCQTLNKNIVFINQVGQIFICSTEALDEDNPFLIGTIDLKTQEVNYPHINLLEKIYNQINIENIAPSAINKSCADCQLHYICSTGCYSKNIQQNQFGNIPTTLYCTYNEYLYNKIKQITSDLDQLHNELFKNYLYGCSIKTIKGI